MDEKRQEFCDRLKIRDSDSDEWNRQHNLQNLTQYEYYKNILKTWVNMQEYPSFATVQSLMETLRIMGFNSAADALARLVDGDETKIGINRKSGQASNRRKRTGPTTCINFKFKNTPIKYRIGQPTLFVGQTESFEELIALHQSKQFYSVLIVGCAGVGKTSLVEKFAAVKPQSGCVAMFDGKSKQKLWRTLENFCHSQNLPSPEKSPIERMKLFISSFGVKKHRFVMIIDGVDEGYEQFTDLIYEFLQLAENVFLILTSRTRFIQHEKLQILFIDNLCAKEGSELAKILLSNRQLSLSDPEMTKFCRYCDGHPYTIVSIVDFIKTIQLKSEQKVSTCFPIKPIIQKSIESITSGQKFGEFPLNISIVLVLVPSTNVHLSTFFKIYRTLFGLQDEKFIQSTTELLLKANEFKFKNGIFSIDLCFLTEIRNKVKFEFSFRRKWLSTFWENFRHTEFCKSGDKDVLEHIWESTAGHIELLSLYKVIPSILLKYFFYDEEDKFIERVFNSYVEYFDEGGDCLLAQLDLFKVGLEINYNKYIFKLQDLYNKIAKKFKNGHYFLDKTEAHIIEIFLPVKSREQITTLGYDDVRRVYQYSATQIKYNNENRNYCSLVDEIILHQCTIMLIDQLFKLNCFVEALSIAKLSCEILKLTESPRFVDAIQHKMEEMETGLNKREMIKFQEFKKKHFESLSFSV